MLAQSWMGSDLTNDDLVKETSNKDDFNGKILGEETIGGRKCWKIPVMEGNFYVEDGFGALEAVAGGNFMIFAKTQVEGLVAAEAAADAIREKCRDVIMPFPGGVCRSGSKAAGGRRSGPCHERAGSSFRNPDFVAAAGHPKTG